MQWNLGWTANLIQITKKGIIAMKKKKQYVKVIILLSVIMLMIGCSKEQSIIQPNQSSFNNPYVWMGELHNEGLDFAKSILAKRSGEVTMDEVIAVTEEFMESKEDELQEYGVTPYEIEYEPIISYGLEGSDIFSGYLDSCMLQGIISDEYYEYSSAILQYAGNQDTASVRALAEDIDNSDLINDEKSALLSSISVYISSAEYWGTDTSKRLAKTTNVILLADLIGAVGGAIAGIPGGWEGVGWGALGGAVGASLGMWLLR